MFNHRLKGIIYPSHRLLVTITSYMFCIKVHSFSTVVKAEFTYKSSRHWSFIHATSQKKISILYFN